MSAVGRLQNWFCFLFGCNYIGIVFILANETVVVDFPPKQIKSFKNLASLEFIQWALTPEYSQYIFRFEGFVKQTGSGFGLNCQDGLAYIIIRSHAVPIPTPQDGKSSPNLLLQHDVGVVYFGQLLLSQKLSETQMSRNVTVAYNFTDVTRYFVALYLPPSYKDGSISGLTQQCRFYMSLKIVARDVSKRNNSLQCLPLQATVPGLKLIRKQNTLFDVDYRLNLSSSENVFSVSPNHSQYFQWRRFSLLDSGGTLKISLKTFPMHGRHEINSSSIVLIGILRNPLMKDSTHFAGSQITLANPTAGNASTWEIPFPVFGVWSIKLSLICKFNDCPNVTQQVGINVRVRACANNCFAGLGRGLCWYYRINELLVAICVCSLGWQGIDCNDGTKALDNDRQLLETLFLTLSNIAFVPCIVFVLIHKYYTEAFLYAMLTISSTFYHACDQRSKVKFCILPYETLQYVDFFYAITSLWFTLLSIADLKQQLESFFQVAGILVLSALISYNRFSALSFAVPFVAGFFIVIIAWGRKSKRLNRFYPGSKMFLYSIVPASLCSGLSIYLNTFVKTSRNYFIVHSIWHFLLGGALFFMLLLKSSQSKNNPYTPEVHTIAETLSSDKQILQPISSTKVLSKTE